MHRDAPVLLSAPYTLNYCSSIPLDILMLITREPALPGRASVKLRVPRPFPEIHKIARVYDIIDNPPRLLPPPRAQMAASLYED